MCVTNILGQLDDLPAERRPPTVSPDTRLWGGIALCLLAGPRALDDPGI